MKGKRLILLGYPGSGKGTVAARLQKEFGLLAVSTGSILREEVAMATELGRSVKAIVDGGGLVPDETVSRIVESRLSDILHSGSGFVLDGYPRTIPQAETLDAYLSRESAPVDRAVYLELDKTIVIKRLGFRRICRNCGAIYHLHASPPARGGVCDRCGGPLYQREDDKELNIRKRLRVYHAQTNPLLHYYQRENVLSRVDASGPPEEVFEEVVRAIASKPFPQWKLTKFPR